MTSRRFISHRVGGRCGTCPAAGAGGGSRVQVGCASSAPQGARRKAESFLFLFFFFHYITPPCPLVSLPGISPLCARARWVGFHVSVCLSLLNVYSLCTDPAMYGNGAGFCLCSLSLVADSCRPSTYSTRPSVETGVSRQRLQTTIHSSESHHRAHCDTSTCATNPESSPYRSESCLLSENYIELVRVPIIRVLHIVHRPGTVGRGDNTMCLCALRLRLRKQPFACSAAGEQLWHRPRPRAGHTSPHDARGGEHRGTASQPHKSPFIHGSRRASRSFAQRVPAEFLRPRVNRGFNAPDPPVLHVKPRSPSP